MNTLPCLSADRDFAQGDRQAERSPRLNARLNESIRAGMGREA
jgi:hypothetical protein